MEKIRSIRGKIPVRSPVTAARASPQPCLSHSCWQLLRKRWQPSPAALPSPGGTAILTGRRPWRRGQWPYMYSPAASTGLATRRTAYHFLGPWLFRAVTPSLQVAGALATRAFRELATSTIRAFGRTPRTSGRTACGGGRRWRRSSTPACCARSSRRRSGTPPRGRTSRTTMKPCMAQVSLAYIPCC